MDLGLDQFRHASFETAVGTFLGYAVILVVMTALLFGIPYLLFVAF